MKRSADWLKSLSTAKRVLLGIVVLFVLAGIGSSQQQATLNTANTANKSTSQPSQKPKAPTITTKTDTETQSIPFTSTTIQTSALAKGTTKVTTTGVNGSQTLTYKITYTNGEQTDKQLVSTIVTTPAVNEVTSVGTYVAPPPKPAPAPAAPQSQTTCTPLTNSGKCYEPGEYCRDSDHGASGVAGDGEHITCADNNGWRWEPS